MTVAFSTPPVPSMSIWLSVSYAPGFEAHLKRLIKSKISSCLNSGYFLLSLIACMLGE